MPKTDEGLTQLATRIPKNLHRRLKLHCVEKDLTVMHFLIAALEEKLRGKTKPRRRAG